MGCGNLGNEAAAIFRIKVGNEINSTALVADGYHACVDGFVSLGVLLSVTWTLCIYRPMTKSSLLW